MKTKLRLLSLCTLIAGTSLVSQAQAEYNTYAHDAEQQVSYGYARVVRSEPLYETLEVDVGREVCRNEPVRYSQSVRERRRSSAGPVLGAIIGGVIGNQFGSGRGRAAATVAGVALGSAIAEDSERDRDYYRDNRHARRYANSHAQVCEYRPEIRRQRELVGYNVTYDYKGQIGRVTTRNQPGNTIRVQVAVTAIED